MALIDAYDTRTGEKLPQLVPEHWIDHPVLGVHLSRLPSQKARAATKAKKSAKADPVNPKPPAVGDNQKEE